MVFGKRKNTFLAILTIASAMSFKILACPKDTAVPEVLNNESKILLTQLTVEEKDGKVVVVDPKKADAKKSRKIFVPAFYAQTSGYQGFVTIGVGTDISPYVNLKALFGYTPAVYIGNKNGLNQATAALEIHPFGDYRFKINLTSSKETKLTLEPFYFGTAATYTPDKHVFWNLPKQYEADYYPQTAVKGLVYFGLSAGIEHKGAERVKFYTGPVYLMKEEIWPMMIGLKDVKLGDILADRTWQFGVAIILDPKQKSK